MIKFRRYKNRKLNKYTQPSKRLPFSQQSINRETKIWSGLHSTFIKLKLYKITESKTFKAVQAQINIFLKTTFYKKIIKRIKYYNVRYIGILVNYFFTKKKIQKSKKTDTYLLNTNNQKLPKINLNYVKKKKRV